MTRCAPYVTRYANVNEFLEAATAPGVPGERRKISTVTVTGVGSSALGSAAFAWNVSAALDEPAASIDGHPIESGEVLNHKHAKALAIDQFESRFLTQAMGCAKGNVSAAARLCGTERRHLGHLLKKHEITPQASP